jgi:hypothetical protein
VTHHPTYEQYMSLPKSSHRRHDELVDMWAKDSQAISTARRSTLRDSIRVETDKEVLRLLDAALRDVERCYLKGPRAVERVERRPDAGVAMVHYRKPEAEPRGPLALRWRLWWMRRRLWWLRARFDGNPGLQLRGSAITAGIYLIGWLITGFVFSGGPSSLGIPVAATVFAATWLLRRGWRTPTVDRMIADVER